MAALPSMAATVGKRAPEFSLPRLEPVTGAPGGSVSLDGVLQATAGAPALIVALRWLG